MGGHHHPVFDPYTRLSSPIRQLPPGLKLAAAVVVVLGVTLVPVQSRWVLLVLPAVMLLLVGVTGLSLLSPWVIVRRVLFLEPVVLGAAMLALFQPHGGRIFFILVLRSSLCLWTMTLLALTTPFEDLLAVLRRLRVPKTLVDTMAMMYRYLQLLRDQSQRMSRARASRTFAAGRWSTWRGLSGMLGQLFIRTADRSERVYAAMCARGWQ